VKRAINELNATCLEEIDDDYLCFLVILTVEMLLYLLYLMEMSSLKKKHNTLNWKN